MREILFRGFHEKANGDSKIIVNGEKKRGYWVYGGIVHQTDYYGEPVDRYYIIDGADTQDLDIGNAYEVIPETVGEYTGLTDKNKKKIFEGDIVLAGDYKWKCKVVWDVECARFICHTNDYEYKFVYVYMQDRNKTSVLKVVGSIFDNPEMVGEKK